MHARLLLVVVVLAAVAGTAATAHRASAVESKEARAQDPINVAELAARFMGCVLGPDAQLIATVDVAEIRAVPSRSTSLGVAETLYTWRRAPVPAERSDQERPFVYRELGNGEAIIMTWHTENGALVNRISSICWQVAWDPNYPVQEQR